MLPGFNHNIRYKNIIFHIQTEDNGEENPIIISHIFVGGNIIATKKQDYSHLLGSEDLNNKIKTLMENQHKELIKELITGKYDSHPLIAGNIESKDISPKPVETASMPQSISDSRRTAQNKKEDKSPFKPVNEPSLFTVFGEGIISEESLDRIILRYLKENK